ncbi:unnamed protein product [Amoebophrya sp. A120]|nr:unnamed protein product [Amoebophrya sp. A120]|eukprot:GSA120T00001038001.1
MASLSMRFAAVVVLSQLLEPCSGADFPPVRRNLFEEFEEVAHIPDSPRTFAAPQPAAADFFDGENELSPIAGINADDFGFGDGPLTPASEASTYANSQNQTPGTPEENLGELAEVVAAPAAQEQAEDVEEQLGPNGTPSSLALSRSSDGDAELSVTLTTPRSTNSSSSSNGSSRPEEHHPSPHSAVAGRGNAVGRCLLDEVSAASCTAGSGRVVSPSVSPGTRASDISGVLADESQENLFADASPCSVILTNPRPEFMSRRGEEGSSCAASSAAPLLSSSARSVDVPVQVVTTTSATQYGGSSSSSSSSAPAPPASTGTSNQLSASARSTVQMIPVEQHQIAQRSRRASAPPTTSILRRSKSTNDLRSRRVKFAPADALETTRRYHVEGTNLRPMPQSVPAQYRQIRPVHIPHAFTAVDTPMSQQLHYPISGFNQPSTAAGTTSRVVGPVVQQHNQAANSYLYQPQQRNSSFQQQFGLGAVPTIPRGGYTFSQ